MLPFPFPFPPPPPFTNHGRPPWLPDLPPPLCSSAAVNFRTTNAAFSSPFCPDSRCVYPGRGLRPGRLHHWLLQRCWRSQQTSSNPLLLLPLAVTASLPLLISVRSTSGSCFHVLPLNPAAPLPNYSFLSVLTAAAIG